MSLPPEPPQNGGYLVAAYIVTLLVLVGYWVRLWVRARKIFGKTLI